MVSDFWRMRRWQKRGRVKLKTISHSQPLAALYIALGGLNWRDLLVQPRNKLQRPMARADWLVKCTVHLDLSYLLLN